jgi:hypothetical protein
MSVYEFTAAAVVGFCSLLRALTCPYDASMILTEPWLLPPSTSPILIWMFCIYRVLWVLESGEPASGEGKCGLFRVNLPTYPNISGDPGFFILPDM